MKGRTINIIIIFFMVCDAISALDGAITGDVSETIKHSAWFCAMGLLLAYRRIEDRS
jgi:uncharacterized membrane protein required for colicin V production